MTVRDDIFMALHDAIGWQEGLADAWPKESPEHTEAMAQIELYKKILKRRYGSTMTALDSMFYKAKRVSIMDLKS